VPKPIQNFPLRRLTITITRLLTCIGLLTIQPTAAAAQPYYFTTATPTLTWTAVTWATGYRVEVETSTTFAAPYAFAGETDADARSITTAPLDDGVYYWRVAAQRPDGSWGTPSPVQSFTIDTDG